ncbi:protein FAM200A-like [Sipha flava]|uniref:Protein FAM200A-like n=1 Tax=Sipha flava TaxID=143950 RepID=A0A8B8GK06_9HEMI|nr:protein FAM200A-like [Sipha flava]
MDADYSRLILYSAVRWLSRGNILSRFYNLREELLVFLIMEESEFNFLGDEEWWTKLSFLTDFDLVDLKLVEEENICSIKDDRTLQLKFKKITLNKFWIYVSKEYPDISIKALTILVAFSPSYLIEQWFSALTNIKNKKREKLNSVEEEKRIISFGWFDISILLDCCIPGKFLLCSDLPLPS